MDENWLYTLCTVFFPVEKKTCVKLNVMPAEDLKSTEQTRRKWRKLASCNHSTIITDNGIENYADFLVRGILAGILFV